MSRQNRAPDKSKMQAALVHQEEHTIMTSGPIPDASTLEGYRRVRADLPDLIIDEWLKEAAARRAKAAADKAAGIEPPAKVERISDGFASLLNGVAGFSP